MSERLSAETEANYPNLVLTGCKKTSPIDPAYNFVAWSQSSNSHWWESTGEPGMWWPEEVPKGIYVDNYVRLFKHFGFSPCENGNFEAGYEKLAIYEFDFEWFGHVAKQLPSGKWTSKLGPDEDVEHDKLEAFDGIWKLDRFMRRQLPALAAAPLVGEPV